MTTAIDIHPQQNSDQQSSWLFHPDDILLGLLLLIGIAMRFYHLGQQGIWLDESISWGFAQFPTRQLIAAAFQDGHPPLHYLLLQGVLFFVPTTEASVRLVSATSSALLLLTIAFHLRKHWGRRAAVYGVLYAALSTFDLYYAQEARMYALLAFLWFLAYALLVEALRGHPRLLIAWGLVNVLTVWTHFYGIFAVGVHLLFIITAWLRQRWKERAFPITDRWLALNVALISTGILPVLYTLWQNRARQHGSAVIPGWSEIGELFTVWSVGLAGGRSLFLDSQHLVLAAFAEITVAQWILIGCVAHGLPMAWGILCGWQHGGVWRQSALLSLLLLVVPLLAVLIYSNLFGLRSWTFRGFIGSASLAYAWAGVGLSQINNRYLRWSLAGVVLGVALLSLLPYWGSWTKTPGPIAFREIPPAQRSSLVLDRAYMSGEVSFYYGAEIKLLGIVQDSDGRPAFARISFPGEPGRIAKNQIIAGCEEELMQQASDLWLYGPVWRIRQEIDEWPDCVWDFKLWVFEEGAWQPFTR